MATDLEGWAVSEHTPGPWRQDSLGRLVGSDGSKVVDSGSGLAFGSEASYPAAPANARLIKAAPKLLAALLECAEYLGEPRQPPYPSVQASVSNALIRNVRAAIEEATKP